MRNYMLQLSFILLIKYGSSQDQKTAATLISDLSRKSSNLSTESPSYVTNKPTKVKIGMYVNNIQEIDHKEMVMSMSGYLRMSWNDPRITFNPEEYGGKKELHIPDGYWKKIWVPDLFMRNMINFEMYSTLREHVLLKISEDGNVWFVVHTTFSVYCPMKLQKYPLDTQTCPIMFESFGYQMDSVYYAWLENPFQLDSSIQLPGYTLTDTILYDCSQNYSTGAFSCLEARFVLRRDSGYFVMQLFIPSIMFVVISWFSFWIEINQYSHRILLLLLMTMILMMQWGQASSQVVSVSYAKAMDVWMMLCLIFVFMAMLEATFVKAIGSQPMKSQNRGKDENEDYATLLGKVYSPSSARRIIDISARVIFPVLFVLVIIVFFSLYTT